MIYQPNIIAHKSKRKHYILTFDVGLQFELGKLLAELAIVSIALE